MKLPREKFQFCQKISFQELRKYSYFSSIDGVSATFYLHFYLRIFIFLKVLFLNKKFILSEYNLVKNSSLRSNLILKNYFEKEIQMYISFEIFIYLKFCFFNFD